MTNRPSHNKVRLLAIWLSLPLGQSASCKWESWLTQPQRQCHSQVMLRIAQTHVDSCYAQHDLNAQMQTGPMMAKSRACQAKPRQNEISCTSSWATGSVCDRIGCSTAAMADRSDWTPLGKTNSWTEVSSLRVWRPGVCLCIEDSQSGYRTQARHLTLLRLNGPGFVCCARSLTLCAPQVTTSSTPTCHALPA